MRFGCVLVAALQGKFILILIFEANGPSIHFYHITMSSGSRDWCTLYELTWDGAQRSTHTYSQYRVGHLSNINVLRLQEEGRIPRENPPRHKEDMQTPHRRAPLGHSHKYNLLGVEQATADHCSPVQSPSVSLSGQCGGATACFHLCNARLSALPKNSI